MQYFHRFILRYIVSCTKAAGGNIMFITPVLTEAKVQIDYRLWLE